MLVEIIFSSLRKKFKKNFRNFGQVIYKTSLRWNHHWFPSARLAGIEEVVNWTEGLADWSSFDGEVHFLEVQVFSAFLSLILSLVF